MNDRLAAAAFNPNRTRDHLANERTYLAWIRTAIALMGFGVVIVRLRHLTPAVQPDQTHGWELGLLFALVGLAVVLLATAHYFQVQNAIEQDTYQPSRRWIWACTVCILLIGTGVLYYLFATPVAMTSSGTGQQDLPGLAGP